MVGAASWVRRPDVRDGLLVLGFALAGTIETLGASGFGAPRGVVLALVLAGAATLWWRRRAVLASALAATLIVFGGAALWQVADTIATPGIVLFCSGFALAAYGARRTAIAGLVAFVVVLGASAVAKGKGLEDAVFLGTIYLIVWGAGMTVRSRQALAARLADRAAILEHERDKSAAAAASSERARIARELHDVVAHCVNVMVLHAGAERRVVEAEHPATAEAFRAIEDTGRQALDELRRLLGIVRTGDEAPLEPQPALADLPTLVQRTRAAGTPVQLDVTGPARPLPPGLELSAYRIVQEALTNSLKHAPNAAVTARVRYRPDALELEVTGAPTSAPPPSKTTGVGAGIIGMHERANLFGGTLRTGPTPEGGWHVQAQLPTDHSATPTR